MSLQPYPDVPLPAGADEVHDWRRATDAPPVFDFRRFYGTERGSARLLWSGHPVRVHIAGKQYRNGRILRYVKIHEGSGDEVVLDAAGLRKLAADLLNAADELDELDGRAN